MKNITLTFLCLAAPMMVGNVPFDEAIPAKIHCGYERWLVKTGQDTAAAQVTAPQPSSIAKLSSYPPPLPHAGKYPPQINKRLAPYEFQSATVVATIVAYRVENDNDIHLVLSDGTRTMIAELTNPRCAGKSLWKAQMTVAREAFLKKTGYIPKPSRNPPPFVKTNLPATVTGVVFFDWPHAQFGAAVNAVEIHPILKIEL